MVAGVPKAGREYAGKSEKEGEWKERVWDGVECDKQDEEEVNVPCCGRIPLVLSP